MVVNNYWNLKHLLRLHMLDELLLLQVNLPVVANN